MSSHKYSHALVVSHFHNNGLLETAGAATKTSHSRRVSQSWTISEVLPLEETSRSASPERIVEVRRIDIQEETMAPRSKLAPTQVSEPRTLLSRSDSVVTQVYAPRCLSPPAEKQRARQSRSLRGVSALRASIIPQEDSWEPRLAARGTTATKVPRCACGGIVQDARLQSSYFPETKAVQKPLPGLPGGAFEKNTTDEAVVSQEPMQRFELAASHSPRLAPNTEVSIKPIRRMAPPRSPSSRSPTSTSSSLSWPMPEVSVGPAHAVGSRVSYSSQTPASRPLPYQQTPPTSPSLDSIFSSISSDLPKSGGEREASRISTQDEDIVVLPLGYSQIGPAMSCSSPLAGMEYPQTPPSPGSSIDDATPPPISRVRRPPPPPTTQNVSARRTSSFTSRSQAFSLLNDGRPATSSGPAQSQVSESQTRSSYPQVLESYRGQTARKPSSDVRRDYIAVPYTHIKPGPEPIPTTERVAPPPPLSAGLREMLGFGFGGRGVGRKGLGLGTSGLDANLMKGLVAT